MKNWMMAAFGAEPKSGDVTDEPRPFDKQKTLDTKTANTSLFALAINNHAQWGVSAYDALSDAGYKGNAIAYRCVRLISESAASVGLSITRGTECCPDDKALKAFSNRATGQALPQILEQFYGYLQVAGDAYLEAIDYDGEVIGFRALRPDRVEAVVNRQGVKTGYKYKINGRSRKLDNDLSTGKSKLFHMRLFDPLDDIYGFAPIEAARKSIDIHNQGAEWNKALLDNAARPSGALIYKGTSGADRLSEDQFERLRDELETAHSGHKRAGRPMLLEGGLEWKPMSMTPSDMDFLNARREAAREIALAFGVPPMLLGIPGDNSYSNYKEANLAFWRMVILPLVKKTASGLERWLQPYFGDDLRVAVDMDDIPALSEERSALWKRLTEASFLTDAERRKIAGLSELGE